MRVLFFSHYFPPEGNAPASRTYENCTRWVRDGHSVTVVTCAPNVPDGVVYEGYKNRLLPQREVVDGIEVIRVWTYIAANKGTLRRIVNFVSYMISAILAALMLLKRPDVVIATSPQFFCGWAGLLYSKLAFRPFVLEIRDLWPATIIEIGAMRAGMALRILHLLEKWMYRGATRIVTVGSGYKEKLVERGVDPDQVFIVTNGVDLDVFQPREASRELREEHGIGDRFACSYIGTIGLCSGLEVIARAGRRLKELGHEDICIWLVGDGAVRERIQAEVEGANLDNIVFSGQQPKELMPDFIASADVCLAHLQKKDLFKTVLPSKIFEAAGMGRAVICGVEGCAAALVDEGGMGLNIEPENEHELVDAIVRLKEDSNLRQGFEGTGLEYVRQHYSRDELARTYLDFLLQLVKA